MLRRHMLLRGRRATQSGPQISGKSEMLVCTSGYMCVQRGTGDSMPQRESHEG